MVGVLKHLIKSQANNKAAYLIWFLSDRIKSQLLILRLCWDLLSSCIAWLRSQRGEFWVLFTARSYKLEIICMICWYERPYEATCWRTINSIEEVDKVTITSAIGFWTFVFNASSSAFWPLTLWIFRIGFTFKYCRLLFVKNVPLPCW